jgi:hypothetical protein
LSELLSPKDKGREQANAEAARGEARRKSRLEEQREQNRQAWIEHYDTLYRSHSRRASEYALKALALKGEEPPDA